MLWVLNNICWTILMVLSLKYTLPDALPERDMDWTVMGSCKIPNPIKPNFNTIAKGTTAAYQRAFSLVSRRRGRTKQSMDEEWLVKLDKIIPFYTSKLLSFSYCN